MQSMSAMVAPVTSLVSRATLSENRRFEWWANLVTGLPASSSSIASSRSSSSRSRRSSYESLSAFVEWLYDESVSYDCGTHVGSPPASPAAGPHSAPLVGGVPRRLRSTGCLAQTAADALLRGSCAVGFTIAS